MRRGEAERGRRRPRPRPAPTAVKIGVAINVVSGELFKITGTEKSGSNTWQKLWEWVTSLSDANRTTVVVGVVALVVLFGLKFLAP